MIQISQVCNLLNVYSLLVTDYRLINANINIIDDNN